MQANTVKERVLILVRISVGSGKRPHSGRKGSRVVIITAGARSKVPRRKWTTSAFAEVAMISKLCLFSRREALNWSRRRTLTQSRSRTLTTPPPPTKPNPKPHRLHLRSKILNHTALPQKPDPKPIMTPPPKPNPKSSPCRSSYTLHGRQRHDFTTLNIRSRTRPRL